MKVTLFEHALSRPYFHFLYATELWFSDCSLLSQMYSVVFGDDLECFLGRLLFAGLGVENDIDASGFAFSDLGSSHLSH